MNENNENDFYLILQCQTNREGKKYFYSIESRNMFQSIKINQIKFIRLKFSFSNGFENLRLK